MDGSPDSPAEDTKDRILRVALELFAAQGFEGTSLREIADRLGFTKAALYYHFRSKDQLVEGLMLPLLAEVDGLLDEAASLPADPPARHDFLDRYLDILLRHRQLIAWLANDLAAVAHPAVGPRAQAQRDRLRELLGGAGLNLDQQVRVTAALGLLQIGVASFPDVAADELRRPLLEAAEAALPVQG